MEKLLQRMLTYPALVLVLIVMLSGGFFAAMTTNSRMETDLDKYMPQAHPAFVYSNQAEEVFDINDSILIAIEHPDGIYNPGTLQKIKDVTKALQKLKEVKKNDVTSLYTADNIIGTEDGMDVTTFYSKVPEDPAELEELRRHVRENEMVFERLVSADETVTVVIAKIEDDVFTQEFYHRILELANSYEGPERLHVAGTPIVEGTLAYLGPKDMQRMVPIVIGVIISRLYFPRHLAGLSEQVFWDFHGLWRDGGDALFAGADSGRYPGIRIPRPPIARKRLSVRMRSRRPMGLQKLLSDTNM